MKISNVNNWFYKLKTELATKATTKNSIGL